MRLSIIIILDETGVRSGTFADVGRGINDQLRGDRSEFLDFRAPDLIIL